MALKTSLFFYKTDIIEHFNEIMTLFSQKKFLIVIF